jgi:hypothetical protein
MVRAIVFGMGALTSGVSFAAEISPGDAPAETAAAMATMEQKAMQAGVQAVIHGLPMVLMDITVPGRRRR